MVNACNINTQEVKAEGVRGQPQLHGSFQASLAMVDMSWETKQWQQNLFAPTYTTPPHSSSVSKHQQSCLVFFFFSDCSLESSFHSLPDNADIRIVDTDFFFQILKLHIPFRWLYCYSALLHPSLSLSHTWCRTQAVWPADSSTVWGIDGYSWYRPGFSVLCISYN